jgi:hypothetical protein
MWLVVSVRRQRTARAALDNAINFWHEVTDYSSIFAIGIKQSFFFSLIPLAIFVQIGD